MKKHLLLSFLGITGAFIMQAQQSKNAVNKMQAADPGFINTANYSAHIVQPHHSTQSISGYYKQGFEGTTFAPAGWRIENIAGPTYTWARSTAQAHAGVASAYMRYDATAGGGQDWLIAPRYLVTASTDSLVFWMRLAFQGYPPDSLCIKVSTTDSASASFGNQTLLKLSEGTNYPPNATTWNRYAISLQNYVGQQIYLAFKHYNNDGDGLYIDDVAIGTIPPNEVSTTAIVSPATTIGAGSVVPQASFMNNGSATSTFNVTATINPGGYTSTTTINALAPNASANGTFAAWNATAGTYTMKVYTELAGDASLLNDTLTQTITVLASFENYGWEPMASLPTGRWATAPVFVKPCVSGTDTGYVYLISGSDAAFATTNATTRYNTVTGTYTNMTNIPTQRLQATPVHVNGKIYAIGGYSTGFTPTNTNNIYDITTDTWTVGAAMPTGTGDYAVGVYNDSLIYYIGGYTGSADVNLVQIYDTYTNTWATGTAKTSIATAGGRMGISGNTIIYVGGYSQTLAATQATVAQGIIDPLNPLTITWTSLANYPGGTTGRHLSGVALENNGLIYFAAGDPNGEGTTTISSVYAFNTATSAWEAGPAMPTGVSNTSGLTGAVYNDSLYLVSMGGYNGTAVITGNQWLNLGPAAPLPYAQNDLSACIDALPLTITAFNGTAYSWSPSGSLNNATIASPTASPSVTTTYTVVMNKAYGCPVTDSVMLTVNDLPVVTASASATTVCAGDSDTLTGGGAVSFVWTGGVTDNTGFVPAATDTYTVTGTDGNGCENTATITITVNDLPVVTASASATTVCAGDSDTLMGSGAVSFVWTGGVTDNTGFVPAATETFTVTGTDGNGCKDTATITITVNDLPNVTASAYATAVCAGNSDTLMGGGAVSFVWTGGVTDNTGFVPAATDTYTVTGTDGNGCENTATITITVNDLPVVTLALTQTTACANYAAFSLGGESPSGGSWSGTGVNGSNFDPAVSGTGVFTITYSYIDGNGCSADATDDITVDPCIGIAAIDNKGEISVFPNPNTGVFSVKLNSTPVKPVQIDIINSLGKIITSFSGSETIKLIDISAIEAGMYFLRINNNGTITMQQLIKE